MTPLSRREFTLSVLGTAAAATRVVSAALPAAQAPRASGIRSGTPDTLAGLTVSEASARIKAGTVTSTDLVNACLSRIDVYNPKVNAFITVTRDQALAQAVALDSTQPLGRAYTNGLDALGQIYRRCEERGLPVMIHLVHAETQISGYLFVSAMALAYWRLHGNDRTAAGTWMVWLFFAAGVIIAVMTAIADVGSTRESPPMPPL